MEVKINQMHIKLFNYKIKSIFVYSMTGIYQQYQNMERDKIILSFKGDITLDLLSSVYQIMESRLDTEEENVKLKKKFYHILVECLQNVYHHKEALKETGDDDDEKNGAMFMIAKDNETSYRIITGNFILNDKAAELEQKLDKISAMNAEELRAYYLETLNTTELSDKGGAGLGMIDIARKSGHRLDYHFHKMSDKYSFFSLGVVVK